MATLKELLAERDSARARYQAATTEGKAAAAKLATFVKG